MYSLPVLGQTKIENKYEVLIMKLTKIFAVVVSLTLCAGVLAGCGGQDAPSQSNSDSQSQSESQSSSESTTVDIKAAADTVLAANPISNQLAVDDNLIKFDLSLSEDSYVAYAGALSNDQNDAGRVIVVQYADGQETAVKDALETYRQNQVAFFGNYPEFADAQNNLKSNYALVSGNGMAILAVASNECTDAAAMISAAEGCVK